MIKFNKTYSTLYALLLVLTSCSTKGLEDLAPIEDAMLFNIGSIAQTRVEYEDQSNNGIAAEFSTNDKIGLYAFYNNFFYYFEEYQQNAESVIFDNQELIVGSDKRLSYTPLRTWTFSTIYGTAPHTLDCVAYYPYNQPSVELTHDKKGAATLEYSYVESGVAKSNIDFMTALNRYDDSLTPEKFRTDMLNLGPIPFHFTRQLASLNFKVTKPVGYGKIEVTGITTCFNAYQKFTQGVNALKKVTWSEMTSGYTLQGSRSCSVLLGETSWNGTPEPDAQHAVEYLLSDDKMLFFPPDTEINKIVFTVKDNEVTKSYTWHPHVETIVANTHYILNLELDPARAN